jgi:unsaturated rhamnogalacturonyl hydrolase
LSLNTYFEFQESIHYKQGDNVQKIIETIANKYISANPPNGFTFRTISTDSFVQLEDGRSDINMNEKFPDSHLGSYAYAFAMVYCENACSAELSLSCYGPTRIFVNGSLFYKSTMADDVNVNHNKHLNIELNKGWNTFFVKLIKTSSGFGCRFGSSNSKWFPLHFLSPFAERTGKGGWVYSEPVTQDVYKESQLPSYDSLEANTSISWFPDLKGNEGENPYSNYQNMFGLQHGKLAYSWSSFVVEDDGKSLFHVNGASAGRVRIWIDRNLVLESEDPQIKASITVTLGRHDIVVESTCAEHEWGYTLFAKINHSQCRFISPADIKGLDTSWIYLGPFEEAIHGPDDIHTLYRLFGEEKLYWRTGQKNCFVRPYLENQLFAKWNYPLGVTLYGLLQAGRDLERNDIVAYVISHIDECTRLYEYSLWDKDKYGYPAINHQLVELNMLDDCGSFGSAMLEAYETHNNETYLQIAHKIADYMMNTQERKENGVFYRLREGEYQENTLWADDLYMSTPFLTRYYKQTGNLACIDEAANQFLLFKQYLYMAEHGVMSHVYDFKYQTPTYVPWGRGNGWVIFSLSELLAILPEAHEKRAELLELFNSLAEGYVKLQGENGLWHQVLTDPTSYGETSCTAMFIYAFCRGIRYGWLEETVPYKEAVKKGWAALSKYAIDKSGNVYGVCRGSGYSFTPEYYKDELNWILNDTHGIGIVILCGIEYMKLQTQLNNTEEAPIVL